MGNDPAVILGTLSKAGDGPARAERYLTDRAISEKFRSSIFYCDNLLEWVAALAEQNIGATVLRFCYDFSLLLPECVTNPEAGQPMEEIDPDAVGDAVGLRDSFLLFPCYGADGCLSKVIARRAGEGEARYRFFDVVFDTVSDSLALFGFEQLDYSQELFAVEGCIDSLFLKNAFCIHGIFNGFRLLSDQRFQAIPSSQVTFILDNDRQMLELLLLEVRVLERGYSLLRWPRDCVFKDFAEMVVAGYDEVALYDFVSANRISATTHPGAIRRGKRQVRRAVVRTLIMRRQNQLKSRLAAVKTDGRRLVHKAGRLYVRTIGRNTRAGRAAANRASRRQGSQGK